MILVSAPAGYGKTTVLAQWFEETDRASVWLSLSKAHDDPATLLGDVVSALDQLEPFDPKRLRELTGSHADFSSVIIPRLERAVASREIPFLLVLDDMQHLRAKAGWTIVETLAEHVPDGSQLAMATRRESPLPLARMQADRRLVTIDATSLAMTTDEGTELLRRAGVDLEREQANRLVEQTEGWPVGLYLASLALRAQDDPRAAASLFAGHDRLVAGYLRNELLRSLTTTLRTFLIRTSILERLSGTLCDAVLKTAGSAKVLDNAARSNLLLVPLDRNGEWYRYHDLFRDMLHVELRNRDPDLERVLHARASEWFEASGDHDAAIDHAIAAGDSGRVDSLIWNSAPVYIGAGRSATVKRWLEPFSLDEIARRPALSVSAAWIAFTLGDNGAVQYWAAVVADMDATALLPDGTPVEAAAALLRALVGTHGLAQMRDNAARSYELGRAGGPFGAVACYLEGSALRLLSQPGAARARLNEADGIGQLVAPAVHAQALTQLALLAIDRDDWREGRRLADECLGAIDDFGLAERPAMAGPFSVAALVHAQAGAATRAQAELDHALFLLSMLSSIGPWLAVDSRLVLARAALQLGGVALARVLCRDAGVLLELIPDGELLEGKLRELEQATDVDSALMGPIASPMTPAEMRVLRYLPTHLTLADIADELFVSRNTVKTHALAIYRKLGVASRHPAVAEARRYGLLEEA